MLRFFPQFALAVLLASCGGEEDSDSRALPPIPLDKGPWRMVLQLGDDELPVNLMIRNEGGFKVDFINAEETITAYQYVESGDSLIVRMPLFDSEFLGVISADRKRYSGVWRNNNRSEKNLIPFEAHHGSSHRFCETNSSIPPERFAKRFRVDFSPEDSAKHYPALGLFEQTPNSNRIIGTFATETGDYRYLEGNFCDGQLQLSCFDGAHAFLFKADYDQGALVNGVFRSGIHWTEPWRAVPDKAFELRDPDSLTYITDTTSIWQTRFYDEESLPRRLDQLNLAGKVTLIQILGTWCPNCIDESRAYKSLYERYHDRGLEIVPLAFENTTDSLRGRAILDEFGRDLDLPYPAYYAGKRGKASTAAAIPALNHVMSYPTTIIIGRDGRVRRVHTGFYGPGTGTYYERWLQSTEMLIDSLLKEKA